MKENLLRMLISTMAVHGRKYSFLDAENKKWLKQNDDPDLEKRIKGLHWINDRGDRTLIYNIKVPIVGKNVDFCLFDGSPKDMIAEKDKKSMRNVPVKYLALGELKGGIDPAGADEHWKTANSALNRIRESFSRKKHSPLTFFVGAAIEKEMAKEIFKQLKAKKLSNGANLTNEQQVVSICAWLISL